ncbi:polycomb protein Asx isoform X3 [Cloeon dipterum]|uniref:polycomb protein Asx isoform X3 n=1 Tax=Cloeon dipterum TaxID=197152 RepID=UPI003220522C
MEGGDDRSVSSNGETTDARPPQDVPPTIAQDESQENAEFVASYVAGPPVSVEEHNAPATDVPEPRPVRRSCRMAAALVRASTAAAATNNNNDHAPKDLNSRHLFSQNHSKKVIKHALRQQAKRRRKNTTIASGNPIAPIPRLVVKTSSLGCPSPASPSSTPKASTMQEVLASIPGFNLKHRKKSARKLSAAAQLEQTKEGLIDLETPDSIFAVLNLSKLLTQETLAQLPLLYQQKLLQLLPEVDRPTSVGALKKDFTGLSNEFFAKACLEWRRRLAEGKFSSENQQKFKFESEKRRKILDPWKSKHFEAIWGERTGEPLEDSPLCPVPSTSSANKASFPPAPVSVTPVPKSSSPCISPVVIAQSLAESPPVPASTPPPEEPSLPQKRFAEEVESVAKKPKLDDSLEADFQNAQELVQESSSPARPEIPVIPPAMEEQEPKEEAVLELQQLPPEEGSVSEQPERAASVEKPSSVDFELSDECKMAKQEILCAEEPIPELQARVVEEVVEEAVIENPISSIVVPLEQNRPEGTVNSSNLFEMARQISNDNDADHNQVIEDVLKAEEEGVVKSLSTSDVHSDLLLQAQFWSMDQSSTNLLGNPSEENVGNPADRVDNVESLAGEMDLVVGQIVKDMEMHQSPIIMPDEANVEISPVEWPIFSTSNSDLQQNMLPTNVQSQMNMFVPHSQPQKMDVMQDHSKLELDMNYGSQAVTTSGPMVSSVPAPPPYSSEPMQLHQLPTSLAPSQSIFSNTQMQLPQPQVAAAPIMTPIPLPLPQQHSLPVMQPLLGPNLRAQVISAVQPQLVNCVAAAAVRPPPLQANLASNMAPGKSSSPGPINNNNNGAASAAAAAAAAAALVGHSVKAHVKAKSQGGRGSRSSSKSTPPGAVNLERSYQICQAVIQNSPNREQLQGQLKVPPSLANKQTTIPSRANQAVQRPRPPAKPAKLPMPPQNSSRMTSIVLRQVISPQGVPVTMAVLPPNQAAAVAARRNSANGAPRPVALPPLQVVDKNSGAATAGTQYILVQRPPLPAPTRASSAPPVPPVALPQAASGRPASTDPSGQEKLLLGRKGPPGGAGGQAPQSCVCNLKAMIMCQKCGAYCHDDCITPNTRLCVTCHIR